MDCQCTSNGGCGYGLARDHHMLHYVHTKWSFTLFCKDHVFLVVWRLHTIDVHIHSTVNLQSLIIIHLLRMTNISNKTVWWSHANKHPLSKCLPPLPSSYIGNFSLVSECLLEYYNHHHRVCRGVQWNIQADTPPQFRFKVMNNGGCNIMSIW